MGTKKKTGRGRPALGRAKRQKFIVRLLPAVAERVRSAAKGAELSEARLIERGLKIYFRHVCNADTGDELFSGSWPVRDADPALCVDEE